MPAGLLSSETWDEKRQGGGRLDRVPEETNQEALRWLIYLEFVSFRITICTWVQK